MTERETDFELDDPVRSLAGHVVDLQAKVRALQERVAWLERRVGKNREKYRQDMKEDWAEAVRKRRQELYEKAVNVLLWDCRVLRGKGERRINDLSKLFQMARRPYVNEWMQWKLLIPADFADFDDAMIEWKISRLNEYMVAGTLRFEDVFTGDVDERLDNARDHRK